uniref:EF-hand domain-containing protein n=2 Tax=Hanusia phi TaxID=3032 RepID=A0A7S0DU51_9CRYP|mmetsp:Transcript_10225/g.23335  ORF Transcript_10225/g.23335 Transcript_10225/m.23335 type:complete len:186 (+) Transcript_10225:175-732(+)
MDTNPGRSERLGRTEQEERYKQVLAVNPKDVDALCGYACFLSTVRDDFAGAAELYSTAVKTDPSRARRITVQLWADLWAMRMENERSMRVKGQWMEYFRKMDTNGEGKLDKKIVQDVLKQTELVISPEDLDAVLQDNKVVYEELAESLSKAPPPNVFSKVQMKLKQVFRGFQAKADEVLLKVKIV